MKFTLEANSLEELVSECSKIVDNFNALATEGPKEKAAAVKKTETAVEKVAKTEVSKAEATEDDTMTNIKKTGISLSDAHKDGYSGVEALMGHYKVKKLSLIAEDKQEEALGFLTKMLAAVQMDDMDKFKKMVGKLKG